jgi:hypothetical protein
MAPLNCGQNALFSRWLSSTLTKLSQAVDPFDKNSLTQQLLKTVCSFSTTPRLDRGGLQRRTEADDHEASGNGRPIRRKRLSICLSFRRLQGCRCVSCSRRSRPTPAPSHWLRLRRLNSAHRELLNRRPRNHRGRSGDELVVLASGAVFQQLSGAVQELPSETLKR